MVVPFSFDACTIDVNCTYEVCCWFSTSLREVFFRVLRFSPLLKNQYFQIPIRPGIKQKVNHFVDVLPPNHYLLFISIILIWSAVFGCEEYSQGLPSKLIVDEY